MAPRSRGADAVQAATAVAAPTAAAPAPAAMATADGEEDSASKEGVVTIPLTDNSPVLDLKGLCAVEHGRSEPLRSYRLLLFGSGKCVRVPSCAGNYVVVDDASWRSVVFPCWVVFDKRTKRKDELAVCVSDYFRGSTDLDVLSVESVMQPLKVRNNVFRDEVRVTRFSDVAGFRPIAPTIDETGIISPWSESFTMYKNLGVGNYKDIAAKYFKMPLRERIDHVFGLADKHAQAAAVESGRQDKTMADRVLAEGTGRLKVLKDKLLALDLDAYDKPLACRICTMDEGDNTALNTPVRQQLQSGTAPTVPRTQFKDRLARAEVMAAPEAAPAASTSAPAEDDDNEFEELDDNEEEEEPNAAAPAAASKPANGSGKAPIRRTPRTRKGKEPAESDENAEQVDLTKQGTEEPGVEVEINNRTGEPYKRKCGAYKKTKGTAPATKRARAARVIATAANVAASISGATAAAAPRTPRSDQQDKITKLQETVVELREEVAQLKNEKTAIRAELELERKAADLRVETACAKTASEFSQKMHKQFVDGLQTGYAMAQQSPMPGAALGGVPLSARMPRMPPGSADGESLGSMPSEERNPFARSPFHSFQ